MLKFFIVLGGMLLQSMIIPPQAGFITRISVDLKVKKLIKSKLYTYDAEICYKANGDMVTYYKPPLGYYQLSDKQGNVRIYTPQDNTLRTIQDAYMGTQSSYFHCFMTYRQGDLALRDQGFTLRNTVFERGHNISIWLPPRLKTSAVSEIKLAHFNNKIVFASYIGHDGKPFKKTYYGKMITLHGVEFPESITEITYTNKERSDSLVEKSYFSNFKVNAQANSPLFDYKIPANAKSK
jgi:hypothetical protein